MTRNYILVFALFEGLAVNAAQPATRGKVARLASASSQHEGSISAPLLGLFAEKGNEVLRGVVGVPGSALVSDPVTLPDGVCRIWLAPGQTWALVEKEGLEGLAILPLNGFEVGELADLEGSVSTIDAIGFAPKAQTAVVYSRILDRLDLIFGGQVAAEISTAGLFSSAIRAVAIDDTGAWPIAITEDGSAYLVSSAQAPQLLYRGEAISDAAFAAGQTRLILADAGLSQIAVIDSLETSPATRVVAVNLGAGAISVQLSQDGASLVAAASTSRSAFRIGISDQSIQSFDLPVEPTRLVRLRNAGSFIFSAEPDGPAWMLVDDGSAMHAGFAARPSDGSSTSSHSVAEVRQ